jgi:hypothetical protein
MFPLHVVVALEPLDLEMNYSDLICTWSQAADTLPSRLDLTTRWKKGKHWDFSIHLHPKSSCAHLASHTSASSSSQEPLTRTGFPTLACQLAVPSRRSGRERTPFWSTASRITAEIFLQGFTFRRASLIRLKSLDLGKDPRGCCGRICISFFLFLICKDPFACCMFSRWRSLSFWSACFGPGACGDGEGGSGCCSCCGGVGLQGGGSCPTLREQRSGRSTIQVITHTLAGSKIWMRDQVYHTSFSFRSNNVYE